MKLEKYHGCGNDFLITLDEGLNYQTITKELCNRHTGFGADGLIVASINPLKMMLYNQDGSIANMCGNGIRCLAYFFVKHGYVKDDLFTIQTLDGPKEILVISKEPFICKVNMGYYSLDKEKMGFTKEDMLNYEIEYSDVDDFISELKDSIYNNKFTLGIEDIKLWCSKYPNNFKLHILSSEYLYVAFMDNQKKEYLDLTMSGEVVPPIISSSFSSFNSFILHTFLD